MPVDRVYDMHCEYEEPTYDGYVDLMRERLMDAYADVRASLKKRAKTQKKIL